MTVVLAVGIVASFVFTAPAFGGPSTLSIAKKALKQANKAEKDARKSSVTSHRLVNGAVTTSKIADGAITAIKIAPGATGNANIADGSLTSSKLADGSVTSSKLADGSVSGAKISDGSVTLKHLAGTDYTGTYDIASVPANTCQTQVVAVPGARVGQFPILAFVGDAALPRDLLITAIKVNAADSVRVKICDPTTGATLAAPGVQIRFITLS
jgi:hypothetical protein